VNPASLSHSIQLILGFIDAQTNNSEQAMKQNFDGKRRCNECGESFDWESRMFSRTQWLLKFKYPEQKARGRLCKSCIAHKMGDGDGTWYSSRYDQLEDGSLVYRHKKEKTNES
jgi:hypothetical protein